MPLPHLETCWLSSLRFLSCCNGCIKKDNPYILPLQWDHNFYLADAVLASNQFLENNISLTNYCRLYLQALMLSDITLAVGVHLDPYLLCGNSGPMSSTTTHHKINQAWPSETSWRIWENATYLWTSKGAKLRQPLGCWLIQASTQHISWPAYYDPNADKIIFCTTLEHYTIHPRSATGFWPYQHSLSVWNAALHWFS
jgi:hypothetical protein